MEVSKKEYRDKQNQATGQIFAVVVGSLIVVLQLLDIIKKYPNSIDYLDVAIVIVWPFIIYTSLLKWRKLEKEIKRMKVVES